MPFTVTAGDRMGGVSFVRSTLREAIAKAIELQDEMPNVVIKDGKGELVDEAVIERFFQEAASDDANGT